MLQHIQASKDQASWRRETKPGKGRAYVQLAPSAALRELGTAKYASTSCREVVVQPTLFLNMGDSGKKERGALTQTGNFEVSVAGPNQNKPDLTLAWLADRPRDAVSLVATFFSRLLRAVGLAGRLVFVLEAGYAGTYCIAVGDRQVAQAVGAMVRPRAGDFFSTYTAPSIEP